ncbi:MAG: glycoside hydrolase family 15 protein [Candidatus Marsarchaeota archaeon]|nr:glycoside hydrolase family 15 protein [Candidatus Marsarchaeota archaeon]
MRSERGRVFLSNGITSALELSGVVDWFPCPRFDSASVFSSIIGGNQSGYFSVKPKTDYEHSVEYVEDSMVVKNRFESKEGSLELTDFLPLGIPAIVRLYESEVPFVIDVKPVFEYGLTNPGIEEENNGRVFRNPNSKESIELLISGSFRFTSDTRAVVEPGKGYLFLMYSKDLRYGLFSNVGYVYANPYDALEKTLRYWREQVMKAKKIEEFSKAYKRSLLTMLGLTYTPSGGAIAAATTSLPEILGGDRNWDYRYVWVRDAAYAAEALAKAGMGYKARKILTFLFSLVDPSSKSFNHPLYSIDGTSPRAEETLDWLSGYRSSKPVRVGNAAYLQVQMDSEGDFMNALHVYFSRSRDTDYIKENWWAVESISDWVIKSWKEPSISMWEERDEKRHVLHTKLMNWVALDRASMLAGSMGYRSKESLWREASNKIKEDILDNSVSEDTGTFVHYYGGNVIDSTLLTMPLYNFVSVENPIFRKTVRLVESRLVSKNGLLLRYVSDFEGEVSNPFVLVNMWLARVHIMMGNLERARSIINKIISYSNDLLLLPEHIDSKTNEPRGNVPQLFSHAGLVEAIVAYNNAKARSSFRP